MLEKGRVSHHGRVGRAFGSVYPFKRAKRARLCGRARPYCARVRDSTLTDSAMQLFFDFLEILWLCRCSLLRAAPRYDQAKDKDVIGEMPKQDRKGEPCVDSTA